MQEKGQRKKREMNKTQIMLEYASYFLLIPYRWGGSHPSIGYDCSGFIQEILASVGLDPKGDQTAQMLYSELKQGPWKEGLQPGSILFFGAGPYQITHVAIALDNYHMIEAGGGNSKTKDIATAATQNAFIRIRPIRKDLVSAMYHITEI
jgi:cell wall-associated NlpC family hydrolase